MLSVKTIAVACSPSAIGSRATGSRRFRAASRSYSIATSTRSAIRPRRWITFLLPVDDALLTLERDNVERRALLSAGGDWAATATRDADAMESAHQGRRGLRAQHDVFGAVRACRRIRVSERGHRGLAKPPQIELNVKSDKPVYGPGDTVTLNFDSTLNGKPEAANPTVSVVDEMVYVLQPEIAPNIVDFFYHPRRNNVRTPSSLSFITYDPRAFAAQGRARRPATRELQRARREGAGTAASRRSGHGRVGRQSENRRERSRDDDLKMPDSLARWRTRAAAPDGMVGQRTAYLRSDKALYLKWSGPSRFRVNDQPAIDMIAFNQTDADMDAQWLVEGGGLSC